MINAIDELRSTLLNRAKPAAQAAPQAAAQPQRTPQMPGSTLVAGQGGSGGLMGSTASEPSSSNQHVPSSLLAGLKSALAGISGAAGAPKTGLTQPSWPGTPAPMGPGELPIGLPNEGARVPPRERRFETGQKMMDAVRNDWSPNPMLIRILQGQGS